MDKENKNSEQKIMDKKKENSEQVIIIENEKKLKQIISDKDNKKLEQIIIIKKNEINHEEEKENITYAFCPIYFLMAIIMILLISFECYLNLEGIKGSYGEIIQILLFFIVMFTCVSSILILCYTCFKCCFPGNNYRILRDLFTVKVVVMVIQLLLLQRNINEIVIVNAVFSVCAISCNMLRSFEKKHENEENPYAYLVILMLILAIAEIFLNLYGYVNYTPKSYGDMTQKYTYPLILTSILLTIIILSSTLWKFHSPKFISISLICMFIVKAIILLILIIQLEYSLLPICGILITDISVYYKCFMLAKIKKD